MRIKLIDIVGVLGALAIISIPAMFFFLK